MLLFETLQSLRALLAQSIVSRSLTAKRDDLTSVSSVSSDSTAGALLTEEQVPLAEGEALHTVTYLNSRCNHYRRYIPLQVPLAEGEAQGVAQEVALPAGKERQLLSALLLHADPLTIVRLFDFALKSEWSPGVGRGEREAFLGALALATMVGGALISLAMVSTCCDLPPALVCHLMDPSDGPIPCSSLTIAHGF